MTRSNRGLASPSTPERPFASPRAATLVMEPSLSQRRLGTLPRKERCWLWSVALAVLVILARAPFLGHGYGGDPDAWRVLLAARGLLETGVYLPSRAPGYPLPEYAAALMLGLGLDSPV